MRRLFMLSALLFALPAHADTIMINNGLAPPNPENVIDDDIVQFDPVYVRNVECPAGWPAGSPDDPCSAPGNPTEVSVVDGGVNHQTGVQWMAAYDSSTINVLNAIVDEVSAYDYSTITMSGGLGSNLSAHDSSTINMVGGLVGGNISAHHSSAVTMSDGESESLSAYDSSTVTMSGGWVPDLSTSGNSTVNIVSGGIVELRIRGSSTITISGGDVFRTTVFDDSTLTINGGILVVGGSGISANDSSLVRITGAGFAVDGSPVPYGDLTALTGTLTGTLASGDPVDNIFNQGGGLYTGTITLLAPTECSDFADNDSDGLIDFPNDPDCDDHLDLSESSPTATPTPGPTPTPAPPTPLDKDQQACVNEMNENGAKVNKAQLKENETCLRDHQKGKLTTTFEVCTTDDRKNKMQKVDDKTAQGDAKKCDSLPVAPPFAFTGATTVFQAAVDGAMALTYAMFGGPPVLDTDLATKVSDTDKAKCQLGMLKQASTLEKTVLKQINKAKKEAIKKEWVGSSSLLETALTDAFTSSDKITSAEQKFAKGVEKMCASLQDPAAAFPGVCADPDLGVVEGCVIAAARCQACLKINAFDDLNLDCDRLDDGGLNWSCP